MLVDVNTLRSHPDKMLFRHVDGVISNIKALTKGLEVSKWTEIVAIFHDLGKVNPNFQDKLDSNKETQGYANHAYLSAYAFFCAFRYNKHNFDLLKKWLGVDILHFDTLIALTIILAKHHGHLLDFKPNKPDEADKRILNSQELERLLLFLNEEKDRLPMIEFSRRYLKDIEDFKHIMVDQKYQDHFLRSFIFDRKLSNNSLSFFLDIQFAFASLVYADKSDAANFITISKSRQDLAEFCKVYPKQLNIFLNSLKPNSRLNELRTAIRKEAILSIEEHLADGKRVFELTSPTGSGKTVILLSLAAEIIRKKGAYRTIYALPFLSITEQIEAEVSKIFKGYEKYIQRIDSKSENPRFNKIQEALDANPDESNIKELGAITFQESVFAYPFIITTFVRFFETLLSNHNATLLKLPNFSKCIFLLDEIQSLPPRLYTFFVAYLDKFCQNFDSYAIVSTATQPNFNLPSKPYGLAKKASVFFSTYQPPVKLLSHEKYFADDTFNRYKVQFEKKEINLEELKSMVLEEDSSVLVILNTIDDSKDFFQILKDELTNEELVLLNTHFTPSDRKYKIDYIKLRLRHRKRVIVISTQLIEAGVDIDFPILYRDFAPVSSIVQSAGRCNRNGKLDQGKVVLFKLRNRFKIRSELIYGRGKDKDILQFTKDAWESSNYVEKELLTVQKDFFNRILDDLNFAEHTQKKFDLKLDFIQDISECMFRKIGKFQLIDEEEYGAEIRYYVPENEFDQRFQHLEIAQGSLLNAVSKPKKNYNEITPLKVKVNTLLKEMAQHIVQVRIKQNEIPPTSKGECLNIYLLSRIDYDEIIGIKLDSSNQLI
jgi:CRISPR-associated endonuclease/helicase Cas3